MESNNKKKTVCFIQTVFYRVNQGKDLRLYDVI